MPGPLDESKPVRPERLATPPASESRGQGAYLRTPAMKRFGLFALGLSLAFAWPLWDLIRMALDSSLYSHVLLIPLVAAFLARSRLRNLSPSPEPGRSAVPAAGFGLAALVVLGAYLVAHVRGMNLTVEDDLFLTILPFVLSLVAGGFYFLGSAFLKAISFPVVLLVFMVPFPTAVTEGLETFFQHTSAEASDLIFQALASPVYRDGLIFVLPGITLQVAQECSGIRSSLVLFITSLIASHLFLTTTWKKWVLTLFVIPLAIVRNAIRIVTIALLCIHLGPEMVHSMIHRKGGPLFFALSLVPFFAVMWLLRRSERGTERKAAELVRKES